MKKMIRKTLKSISVLLLVSVFLATIPQTTVDVYAIADNYDLFVGGQQVGPDHLSGRGWRYIAASRTLILENDFDEDHPTVISPGEERAPIEAGSDLPDLTIELDSNGNLHADSTSQYYAIRYSGTGTLTITGSGKLEVEGCIYSKGDIVIKNTTVNIETGLYPAISAGLQVDNNNLSVSNVNAADITIDNSRVTAVGGLNGLLASGTVSVKGKDTSVEATAGKDSAVEAVCPAIEAGGITIGEGLKIVEPENSEKRSRGNGGNPEMFAVYDKDADKFAKKVVINSGEVSAKVTFKVENGSWDDGSSEDKQVSLKEDYGKKLKLKSGQIPEVGNKPAAGYKAGSWDKTPDTQTEIKDDTVYTYSYIKESEHLVTVKTDGHGTAKASPKSAAKGATITLSAKADDGYRFDKWQVISGNITIENGTFRMPDEDVTVKACFEEKDDDDDDDDDDDEPAQSKQNERYPDGCDELRGLLANAIASANATGKEQIVSWNKGTSLPYDVMKMLQDNPKITLVFSYTFEEKAYNITIPGRLVIADPAIPWYGPICLYGLFGNVKASANTSNMIALKDTYTVQPGDTLTEIARNNNTSVRHLQTVNNIKDPDKIKPGMVLKL